MSDFISISGLAGSGKTTVSNYLKQQFLIAGYSINDFSFAGPLKDALCLWFNWDRKRLDSDFAYKEGDRLDDGSPDPYCEALRMTRRVIMQRFGTECMRQGMHQNFWIIMADMGVRLNKIPPSDLYVISDARFVNELDWAKSLNGYRIKITREDSSGANTLTTSTTHASETEFLDWPHYDIEVFNKINLTTSTAVNLEILYETLDTEVTPAIKERFDLRELSLYR